jgi:membrane associated rhomboid family serine protease
MVNKMATRQVKSIKTTSIASEAYNANGVGNTLDVLENQSITSYLVSSVKLSVVAVWAAIAGFIGLLAYAKEMSKPEQEDSNLASA